MGEGCRGGGKRHPTGAYKKSAGPVAYGGRVVKARQGVRCKMDAGTMERMRRDLGEGAGATADESSDERLRDGDSWVVTGGVMLGREPEPFGDG